MAKIEVKSKQSKEWPNCKGTNQKDSFIVFVDFENKQLSEKPDYYILTADDWKKIVEGEKNKYLEKHPDRRAEITSEGYLLLPDEVNQQGKPYTGCGIWPNILREYEDAWEKIISYIE